MPTEPGTGPGAVRARGPVDPRLLRRARSVRRFLVLAVLIGSATAAAVVGQAWLIASAVGAGFAERSLTPALAVLPGLVLVIMVRAGLNWLTHTVGARAAAAVKSQLRLEIMTARLSAPDTPEVPAGRLVTMITGGLDALDGYFAKYLPQLVLAVTVPLIIGVAILAADPVSALIVALTLPLIPLFMILVGWMTQALTRRRFAAQSRLAHHFADLVAGLPTLQVFGRARAQAEGLRRSGELHRRETLRTLRVALLSALVLEVLASLSVALVAVGIGLRVVEGDLTLTIGLFVLILAPEAYLPLRLVGAHYHDSADGVAAVEQAFAVIDHRPHPEPVAAAFPLGASTIELAELTVRYPDADHPAVADVDLVINPGELVALAGPSGSGKSTLLQVLLGFRRPTAGTVRIGGTALADLDQDRWRAQLAWVPQQPALISGTVADNVELGAPGAPPGRIRAALLRAGAQDIDPDRPLPAAGAELSAGELRRVALARALLKIDCGGARWLLLDEPTAGLDPDTELAAIAGVRELGVGGLVVSHRAAVLDAADRIVALAGSSGDDQVACPSTGSANGGLDDHR
ncbi:thiol reductant ABC exporter subunit CydD [Microlunatus parietis]|uniref:Thiol reductant ABC exporter CydD subunit n=1 Tax=Microlunatus parietis TaxID=682979 RepID=A0A7Y9LC32_9ACTN|nr:thiol reductant ABC exporter subunit CydD [Microlunatus parietis]NYE72392.1 thiol reductant ABC exporter CydD subunit [Microlunatus parietis]